MKSGFNHVCRLGLLLLVGLANTALAQGIVRGQVSDQSTNRLLESAEVRIVELGRRALSDASGTYQFLDVPEGTHTITVRYLGYEIGRSTIAVAGSGTFEADIGLASVATEEIVVKGYRAALASALQDKRMSDMIKETLTADDAGKLPDQNVAEALRRITGVTSTVDQGEGRYVTIRGIDSSYTNVTLDNQVIGSPEDNRNIALDTIPSEVLSRVEVVKAVTADMDGQAVGGAINIVTPSAFDEPDGRLFSVTADYGYYDLNGKSPYSIAAGAATTFGPEDRWGFLLSASYSDRHFWSDNLQGGDPWEDENGFLIPDEVVLRDYRIDRIRAGVVANLEFKVNDDTKLYLRNLYNNYEDTELQSETIWAYREGDLENQTPTSGTFTEGEGEKLVSDRLEKQKIRSSTLGGEFSLGSWLLDASVTVGQAKQDTPRDREWSFELADGIPMDYDTSNLFFTVDAGPDFNDPSLFEFNEYLRGGQIITEDIDAFAVDLERDIDFANTTATIKFGAKQVERDKRSDQDMVAFDGYAVDLTLDGFTTPGRSDFYCSEGCYDFGPRMLFPSLETFFDANSADFEVSDADTVVESFGVDFRVREKVTAGYLMGTMSIGRATINAGVRFEDTSTDFSAFDLIFLDGDAEPPVPVSGASSYTDWLPSVHLRMAITDNLLFRAAWTNTIGRPSYEVLAPFRIFEIDEDSPGVFEGEAEAGNSDLVPLESSNFDLALEWYLESGGILAAGIFFKDIDNPIFTRFLEFEDADFEGRFFSELVVETTDNADTGEILGIELNYQQQFVDLPPPFNGFGVALNYTYADSEATVFDRAEKVPFFLQSEHIGNAALYYERSGFEARIAYTYYSTYLDSIGDDVTQDLYLDDRGQLDLKASYEVGENWSVFAEFLNLTDEPLRFFSGRRSGRLAENEIYGWNAKVGVSLRY